MALYPVHRQMLPARPVFIVSRDGFGPSATAARIIPGVQMPHCAPPNRTNASCSGCLPPRPSIVVTRLPDTCANGTRHEFTGSPSTRTVHAPHSPSPHPSFVPVRPHSFLSAPAFNLSGGQCGMNHLADFMDGREPDRPHFPGRSIDFDLDDVARPAEGAVRIAAIEDVIPHHFRWAVVLLRDDERSVLSEI